MIAALTPTTVHAQSSMFVAGFGNNSCGKYLAAVHGHPPGTGRVLNRPEGPFYDEYVLYLEWLARFFGAANWWVIDERNQLRDDKAATDVWIRKWCEQNPTKPLVSAAAAFVSDQRKEYLQGWRARQAR